MAVTETSQAASRALDDLYRQHGAEVYRYALAVLGNHADAEDVTQTTFLNAYRSLEQGVRPRKPSNWLLTIASNTIKQRFRQERSRPRQVELDDQVAGTSPDESGPTVGEVLTALSRIPPSQRQAIVLREFEGRSYKEIAAILDVSTSALETLLFRARRSLADELEHHLTCTEAQQAVSQAADGRLRRKERRRLREHLDECPDCARFARLQQRNRSALRGLLLVPVPVSLTLFKGLEGSAAAAALPASGIGAAAATSGLGAAGATGGGLLAAGGTAGATGGGLLAGGVAVKAAAVVTAATVATGGLVGATELSDRSGPRPPSSPALVKPGKSATAPGRSVSNGKAKGKAAAPGQGRVSGGPAPGQVGKAAKTRASKSGDRPNANVRGQGSEGRPSVPARGSPEKKPRPTASGKASRATAKGTSRSVPTETSKADKAASTSKSKKQARATKLERAPKPTVEPGTVAAGRGSAGSGK
jgi:RNA polymerase sigma factor (sigma-70 family)